MRITKFLEGDVICRDFGGSSPSGTSTTTVENSPIPAVEDALGRLIPQAEALATTPVEAPDFNTVVPFSFQTEDALQLQEARATGGSDLERAAQDLTLQTARGDFLNTKNSGFDEFAQTLTGDIGSQIQAQFGAAGRLGSGANSEALGRGIGNALSPLAFQQFEGAQNRQLAAAELAPQLAAIDFRNIEALRDVGQQREGQFGAELQDTLNRFNFEQQEPRQRIAEALALIGGGQFGGIQQQTSPTFSNGASSTIGGIAGLSSIFASLFGSGGFFG